MYQGRGSFDPQMKVKSQNFIASGGANEFMRLVYAVMAIGLTITGLTAYGILERV